MKRIFLLAGVIGWGISILGVLLPWSVMDIVLQNMGAASPITDVQVQYWFRMATTAWSIIGFLYLMILLNPQKYNNLISLLAWGTVFEGIVLLIHGLYLNLPLFPFAGDVGFCLIVGGGLLLTNKR